MKPSDVEVIEEKSDVQKTRKSSVLHALKNFFMVSSAGKKLGWLEEVGLLGTS
jgi:hypothetical protein